MLVVASTHRWGEQTQKAIDNFPVSGERIPQSMVEALAMIKAESAAVNTDLGILSESMGSAIRQAADEIVRGEMADQFPVDVFQTGSGTSTNMNMNEVIANRAAEILGDAVHPNDHVNASQSSNDTFPTAARVASVLQLRATLLPALESLRASLLDLSSRHQETVKMARTHLMDAVPMTFGQEVSGWARAIELSSERVDALLSRLAELPIGGTAVGTGLNAPRGFGSMVAQRLTARTGCTFTEATNHFEAQSSQDAMVEAGATLKVVALSLHKIAGDLRLLGSGPNGGLGEITLPAASSRKFDHARQGEPRHPRNGPTGNSASCRQRRDDDVRGDDVDAAAQHGDADHRTQLVVVHSPPRQCGIAARPREHSRHRGRPRTDAAQRRTVPRHRHGTGASYRIRRGNQARAPGEEQGVSLAELIEQQDVGGSPIGDALLAMTRPAD